MKLFKIVVACFAFALLASLWQPAADAHQPGVSTDIQTLASATAVLPSNNISPTYRNVRDASTFALQYRGTIASGSPNYRLELFTSLDDVNYVNTATITATNIDQLWHTATLTPGVCSSFRVQARDLGATTGVTMDMIVGSK